MGLRVRFIKGDPPQLAVVFQEATLLKVGFSSPLSKNQTGSPAPNQLREQLHVSVAHGEINGLRVTVDGVVVVDRLRLVPWAPATGWTFGFGATANDP